MTHSFNFSEVDTLKNKLNALRPLPAEVYQKIRHKLSIDWTYNSNAIEGNTLTLSETKFFLEVGLTSKGKPLSEYLEIKNHQHAIKYLYDLLQEKKSEPLLSERLIKEIHAMIFERNESYQIEDENGKKVTVSVLPGKYKQQNNYVLLPDGTRKFYLDPLQTVDAMQGLIRFYQENLKTMHPIELAAEIHTQFVAIHPFVDGNGRVARIIMNLILLQAGFEPAVIQNELKADYYEALRHYDDTSDIQPMTDIIEQEVIRTLQITLNAAKGKLILDTEDITKRTQNFSQRMSALDKDIGTFTKKATREEKERSIKHIRDYFAHLAEKKLAEIESELFSFEIKNSVRLEKLHQTIGESIIRELVRKDVIPTILKIDSEKYQDFLEDENNGSGLRLSLKSQRIFIPSSDYIIFVIPTKYTLCVCAIVTISGLNEKEGEVLEKPIINFVQNGVIWEDWHKGDLDTFFNDTFAHFLDLVETEAESRRQRFAEESET